MGDGVPCSSSVNGCVEFIIVLIRDQIERAFCHVVSVIFTAGYYTIFILKTVAFGGRGGWIGWVVGILAGSGCMRSGWGVVCLATHNESAPLGTSVVASDLCWSS